MGLKVGIVGLPNVGKSTLFNAILGRQAALTAPYPFATVEPNVGVVDVPDERLVKLREAMFPREGGREKKSLSPSLSIPVSQPQPLSSSWRVPIVPATVTFVDIAGLVKGAAEGQGLGNQFLAHIRDVDLILHVLRDFDAGIPRAADSKNPEYDAEIVRTELELKDLEVAERKPKGSDPSTLTKGSDPFALAEKPVIYAVNIGEEKLAAVISSEERSDESRDPASGASDIDIASLDSSTPPTGVGVARNDGWAVRDDGGRVFYFCAKIEEEISKMPKIEQKEYLKIYGLERSCLDRIIGECFRALGLISFFTAGPKEVRAWPARRDPPAPAAAGVIHSDFEKLFIRAEVIGWEKLAAAGSWIEAKNRGWVRTEGRDYLVKDGEVCNFLIGK